MAKTILKLNRLNNPESFIQVNTIKGFKYVDKAGEIVNAYHNKNIPPQFTMGLDGLVIEKPKDKVSQLKVTAQVIWEKFHQIDSLDMISTLFSNDADKILKILEVEKISRIGWRNYFVYEFSSKEEQDEYLKRLTIVDETNPSLVRLEIKTEKDFSVNLMIQPVIKNDTDKTHGVLFDVDIFQNGEFKSEDISTLLKDFRQYLTDENGFLSVINKTFE